MWVRRIDLSVAISGRGEEADDVGPSLRRLDVEPQ
jgi:hypothetical protein